MSLHYDAPIVIEPPQAARQCVIWMHGLGADGSDFVPIVPELGLPAEHAIRFIFPHAAVMPVTINNGYQMRAWYDIPEMNLGRKVDEAGVAESSTYILRLIDEQKAQGISEENIVLAGFSQGGVIAFDVALQMQTKPAGVLALSTYLISAHQNGQGLKVLQCHGIQDTVVPLSLGEAARDEVINRGAEVTWRTYPMEHSVHPAEISDVGAWLAERLS
jgi:phospholipase/carboxylesterase